jgi:hypothetical protein
VEIQDNALSPLLHFVLDDLPNLPPLSLLTLTIDLNMRALLEGHEDKGGITVSVVLVA